MAKVSRNQLKGIVKECLMEILAEGLLHEEPSSPKRRHPGRPRKTTQSIVEHVESQDDPFDIAVNNTVSGLTDNPIMTDIFRDTAMTTLQEQLGAEKNPRAVSGGDAASHEVAGAEINDLFPEASDRWASLAFAEKKDRP
jgi:hypothetical protein